MVCKLLCCDAPQVRLQLSLRCQVRWCWRLLGQVSHACCHRAEAAVSFPSAFFFREELLPRSFVFELDLHLGLLLGSCRSRLPCSGGCMLILFTSSLCGSGFCCTLPAKLLCFRVLLVFFQALFGVRRCWSSPPARRSRQHLSSSLSKEVYYANNSLSPILISRRMPFSSGAVLHNLLAALLHQSGSREHAVAHLCEEHPAASSWIRNFAR